MAIRPVQKKIIVVLHALSSVGLLGSIVSFFALGCAALAATGDELPSTYSAAMLLNSIYVIVPLALAANITGLILALKTHWGLFKHRWVLVKFMMTLFATVVLLIKLRLIFRVADCFGSSACLLESPRHGELELVVHAAMGFLVLLMPLVLTIFKPWGLVQIPQQRV